jgi:hypothetical protein
MKYLFAIVLSLILGGCMYRIDVTAKHDSTIGEWRLKTDAYIIRYDDDISARYVAYACVPSNSIYFPDREYRFSEARVGVTKNGTKIIGAIRAGTVVSIDRVIEDHHATMGISYHPYATTNDGHGKVRKVDFTSYCAASTDQKALNPEWIERIQ